MSLIRALFNLPRVSQLEESVMFSGVRTVRFFREIQRCLGTGRIQTGMITHESANSFRVPFFFIFDFKHVLALTEANHTRYYNVEIIREVLRQLADLPIIRRSVANYPSKLDTSQLSKFVFTPLKAHQEFFEVYDQKTQQYGLKGYILAAAPGSGKTVSSLMLAYQLKNVDTIVVFSPTNALYEVWEDTVRYKIKTDNKCFVYNKGQPVGDEKVFIFSHDNLKYAKEVIFKLLKKKRLCVIVDECHAFNEIKSDRTNFLIEICKEVELTELVFMSGTPFKAFGREVIPFLWCSDPYFNQEASEAFIKVFGTQGTRAVEILAARIGRSLHKIEKSEVVQNQITNFDLRVTIPNGERFTMETISNKMEQFIVERVRHYKEVGPMLVHRYLTIRENYGRLLTGEMLKDFERYCRLADAIRETTDYASVKNEIREANLYERKIFIPLLSSHDKKAFRDSSSVYKYVALKIQGEALGRILGKERISCNLAVLEHLDNAKAYCVELEMEGEPFNIQDIFESSESKVVFFTDYVEVLEAAEKQLRKKGYHPKVVYGETNKDLSDTLAKFEKDPKVNPVIATIKSLSTAVPLIMADTEVLLNVPYRDYIYKQTIARVDRLGQKHPIKIFHVYLDTGDKPNVSTRSKDLMEWSKQMVDQLLGLKTTEVDEEVVEGELGDDFIQKTSSVKNDKKIGF